MEPLQANGAESTDPLMACNALGYQAATMKLQGTRENYFIGPQYGAQAPLAKMLATTVEGALLAQKGPIIKQVGKIFGSPPAAPAVASREFAANRDDARLQA